MVDELLVIINTSIACISSRFYHRFLQNVGICSFVSRFRAGLFVRGEFDTGFDFECDDPLNLKIKEAKRIDPFFDFLGAIKLVLKVRNE